MFIVEFKLNQMLNDFHWFISQFATNFQIYNLYFPVIIVMW